MQHEIFPILALERVDDLLVLAGPQGRHRQCLSFAASKQRRAMGARQYPDLGGNRPHRSGVAAVDPAPAVEHGAAHDLLFEVLEQLERQAALDFVGEQLGHPRLGRVEPVAAVLLALLAVGGVDQRTDFIAQSGLDRADFGRGGRQGPRVAGAQFGELDDRLDHRLERAMAEGHRTQHDFFGEFARLGLDHQHALAGAGDDEIELRAGELGRNRVQHIFAVDIADPCAGDRSEKRNARDRQGRRSANHRHDIGIVFKVVAQYRADDLGLIAEPGSEQRAQRPVNQPRDQSFLFRRTAFALEEAAGDLAGGKGLFLVIDGQREKVLAGLCGLHRDSGAQHGRLAISGEHRAVGLAGELAGLQGEAAAAPYQLFTINLKHS